MHPLQELEANTSARKHDPEFQREMAYYLKEFVAAPRPLFCRTPHQGTRRRKDLFSREDLKPHRLAPLNNAIGQILVGPSAWARRASRRDRRGPHGVARPPSPDVRDEMRHLHGRGGLASGRNSRLSHENARRGSRAGSRRPKDAQGSRERSHARWVTNLRSHALHSRHVTARILSGDVRNFQRIIGDRGARADFWKRKAPAGHSHRLCRRRLERHRPFLSVPRRQIREARRRGSRRTRHPAEQHAARFQGGSLGVFAGHAQLTFCRTNSARIQSTHQRQRRTRLRRRRAEHAWLRDASRPNTPTPPTTSP